MSTLNIQLLKASIEAIKPVAEEFSTEFYRILFEIAPQARPLFVDTDFEKQKSMLIKSLVFVVNNLEDPEHLNKYLKSLGARHIDYGATKDHYPIVGDALLKTFRHFFRENWTHELEETWLTGLQAVSNVMLEGSLEAAAKPKTRAMPALTKKRIVETPRPPEPLKEESGNTSWTSKLVNSLVEKILANEKFKNALREDAKSAMAELQQSREADSAVIDDENVEVG